MPLKIFCTKMYSKISAKKYKSNRRNTVKEILRAIKKRSLISGQFLIDYPNSTKNS